VVAELAAVLAWGTRAEPDAGSTWGALCGASPRADGDAGARGDGAVAALGSGGRVAELADELCGARVEELGEGLD